MKGKILIVDDIPANLGLIVDLLSETGFEISVAEDGLSALEQVEFFKPDLILLDVMMPGMDGFETCNRLKQNEGTKNIPVIFMTALTEIQDKIKGFEVGGVDYIVKPIQREEVLARVNTHLTICSQQKELNDAYKKMAELYEKLENEFLKMGKLQKQLLPQNSPKSEGYQIEFYYSPCDYVGGDYYDFFQIDERYTAFIIADVSGHGAPSMMTMTYARNYLKLLNMRETSPEVALNTLNNHVSQHLETGHFVTMFYSIYDKQEKKLAYSSAGHNPPLIYRQKEDSSYLLKVNDGVPLMLYPEDSDFPEQSVFIESGDVLLLYTDGYIEAQNDREEFLGLEKMQDTFHKAVKMPEDKLSLFVSELKAFTGDVKLDDDVALVLVSFT